MNWLKYSGIFITVTVNPCHWRLGLEYGKDELGCVWSCRASLLFIGIHIVIDDGQW